MRCSVCGADVDSSQVFCGKCGSEVHPENSIISSSEAYTSPIINMNNVPMNGNYVSNAKMGAGYNNQQYGNAPMNMGMNQQGMYSNPNMMPGQQPNYGYNQYGNPQAANFQAPGMYMNQSNYPMQGAPNVNVFVNDRRSELHIKGKISGFAGNIIAIIAIFCPFITVFSAKVSANVLAGDVKEDSISFNLFNFEGDYKTLAIIVGIIILASSLLGIYYCYAEKGPGLILCGILDIIAAIAEVCIYSRVNDQSGSKGGYFLFWGGYTDIEIVLGIGFYLLIGAAIDVIVSGCICYYNKQNMQKMGQYRGY